MNLFFIISILIVEVRNPQSASRRSASDAARSAAAPAQHRFAGQELLTDRPAPPQQNFDRAAADFRHRLAHGSQFEQRRVVVGVPEAGDGYLVRHPPPELLELIKHIHRNQVVAAEDHVGRLRPVQNLPQLPPALLRQRTVLAHAVQFPVNRQPGLLKTVDRAAETAARGVDLRKDADTRKTAESIAGQRLYEQPHRVVVILSDKVAADRVAADHRRIDHDTAQFILLEQIEQAIVEAVKIVADERDEDDAARPVPLQPDDRAANRLRIRRDRHHAELRPLCKRAALHAFYGLGIQQHDLRVEEHDRFRLRFAVRIATADDTADAVPVLHHTALDQAPECAADGSARHAEFAGQLIFGRQPAADRVLRHGDPSEQFIGDSFLGMHGSGSIRSGSLFPSLYIMAESETDSKA